MTLVCTFSCERLHVNYHWSPTTVRNNSLWLAYPKKIRSWREHASSRLGGHVQAERCLLLVGQNSFRTGSEERNRREAGQNQLQSICLVEESTDAEFEGRDQD